MRRLTTTAAIIAALTLTGCATTQPATTTPESTPAATPESAVQTTTNPAAEPIYTKDEALTQLAETLSSSTTTAQWEALTSKICTLYTENEKPLDKPGDTAKHVEEYILNQPFLDGDGTVPARIVVKDLSTEQLQFLIFVAPQVSCTDWYPEAADYLQLTQ